MSRKWIGFAVFAVVMLSIPLVPGVPDYWVTLLDFVGVASLVSLGLVLLTGVGGMTSFGQAAFVGFGAYATALLKMHGFLRSLKPDTVFHQYKGAPSPEDHDRLLQLATRNLGTGRRYLGIKLMSAGILHALAQTTGGDAPVALFMGDLNPQEEGSHLAAHLPKRPTNCGRADDETDDLYRLLAHGRASESRFDLQHSPLSLFVYRCLADDQLDAGVAAAGEMFAGKRTPQQFLDDLPGKTVAAIARAAAFMAFTRARELNAIADRREQ